jgi:O-acetyl-ADP-ribose deacetylase (regulator of RNase III)
MIRESFGNLLDSDAEALINTVNTVGVMGKGLAAQFKRAFPENYWAYHRACEAGAVRTGQMFIWVLGDGRYIINFPTKKHWRLGSNLPDIRTGLDDLVHQIQELSIRSVAIPPLGCGFGGLRWADVRPLIEGAFDKAPDVEVILFPPRRAISVGFCFRCDSFTERAWSEREDPPSWVCADCGTAPHKPRSRPDGAPGENV